jgi:hypothetical protein
LRRFGTDFHAQGDGPKDTIAITIAMVCVPMSLSAPAFSADRRKVVVAQQLSLIRSPDAPICVRNLG